jgi:hypothetical protein
MRRTPPRLLGAVTPSDQVARVLLKVEAQLLFEFLFLLPAV